MVGNLTLHTVASLVGPPVAAAQLFLSFRILTFTVLTPPPPPVRRKKVLGGGGGGFCSMVIAPPALPPRASPLAPSSFPLPAPTTGWFGHEKRVERSWLQIGRRCKDLEATFLPGNFKGGSARIYFPLL